MANGHRADVTTKLSRRERADQTRLRMIEAAYRSFLERGYEATTMQDVADAAGVAVQTVYYTFKTKAQLLAEAESFAVLGDRPHGEWRNSPLPQKLRTASNSDELVKVFVAMDTEIKCRLAPFVTAVGAALPSDPDSVAGRSRGREEFFKAFVDRLTQLGPLQAGMTARRALDILLAVNSLPTFIELTTRRGWTSRQWQTWLVRTIKTQLLP